MKYDNFYNVGDDYTMIVLDIAQWMKQHYSVERLHKLPRLLWAKKSWTLQELHLHVFKHVRGIISEWCDIADPNTTRVPRKSDSNDLKTKLIEFPYRVNE